MRRFALKISIWNTVGYCFAVGIPTIIDPTLEQHVQYAARDYPLGYWVFLPSILVFALTYRVCLKDWSAIKKSFASLGVIVAITGVMLFNFQPEFPHPLVAFTSMWFGILVAIPVWVRTHRINYDYIYNEEIDKTIKIERAKMEHDTWFKILLGLLAGYITGLIYIYMFVTDFFVSITPSPAEQMDLKVAFSFCIFFNVLLFLTGVVWEMIIKIAEINDSILKVR